MLYDDSHLIAHTEEDIQAIMDFFSRACTTFKLTISLKNLKVLFTPPSDQPYVKPNIFIKDTKLGMFDSFVYLSSTFPRAGCLNSGINLKSKKSERFSESLKAV